jgi:CheY-like chemotaxis protein
LADTGLLIEVADNGQRAVELFQSRMPSQLAPPSGAQPSEPILPERMPQEHFLPEQMPSERILPELILMDIQMPVMDGHEAARRIRALDARVPIIALTANAFPEDIEKAHAAGMNAHLSKPIDLQRLKALLGEFLQPARSL